MDNFTFVSPTKIILEGKVEDVIGREVKTHADHVLLVHYGDDFFYRSGLYDRIVNSLKKEQVEVDEIFGIQPNPVLEPIRKGIALCREKGRGGIPLRHGAETGDSYIYTGWKSCSL